MKDREESIHIARLVLRYLDYQHALGQPADTLDRQLEDAARRLLERYGASAALSR